MALSLMLGGGGVGRAQAAVSEKDAAEIRSKLQGMEDAWNRHDVKAYVSCMSDDMERRNVVGMWWKGKDQVYGT
jgi:ketosteroid isomerase-like protein